MMRSDAGIQVAASPPKVLAEPGRVKASETPMLAGIEGDCDDIRSVARPAS